MTVVLTRFTMIDEVSLYTSGSDTQLKSETIMLSDRCSSSQGGSGDWGDAEDMDVDSNLKELLSNEARRSSVLSGTTSSQEGRVRVATGESFPSVPDDVSSKSSTLTMLLRTLG